MLTMFALATALSCNPPPPEAKPAPASAPADQNAEAQSFLTAQVATYADLEKNANLAWYQASITGTDAEFQKSADADNAKNAYLADAQVFEKLQAFRKGTQITDPSLLRQLDLLYLLMLTKQVDKETLGKITALEKKVEQAFNTFRGKVDGKELTQNQLNDILRSSTDSKKLKAAWEAQKAVGPVIAPLMKELIALRNDVAKKLGYRDFFAMSLAQAELDETKLLALFDNLDTLTREPFFKAKADVDVRVAKRLKVKPTELMPWHYQNPFFQEPPDVFETGLDAVYKKQDTLAVAKRFYEGLGFEVDPIVKRSDLFEKAGKTPHAFEVNIDRKEDIRMLANIVPGLEWQGTTIHEMGHAIYDVYLGKELPWLMTEAAHPLTTEGFAMMIDRLVENPAWTEAMGLIDAKTRDKVMPEAKAKAAFGALQFSRWTQVILRFEKEMYGNPEQDLNKLWWDLVEKYQGLKRPEGRQAPDYASKIHVAIVPVYYQNYMMGELFGAQLHEAIAASLGADPATTVYVGKPEVGTFLKEKLFAPGRRMHFEQLTETITGKPLSAEAFARRFTP